MVKYCKLDSTELLLEVGQFVFSGPRRPFLPAAFSNSEKDFSASGS